mmetsp:Transcript_16056/g.37938  ORF Transcript_16056/g.37938 Transcript_16056/m.37938 type:complete len:252 (+) Transcript_16056:689-1444(+)
MARDAARHRQHTGCRVNPVDVIRACLASHEDDLLSVTGPTQGLISTEDCFSSRSTGRCGQTLGDHLLIRRGVDCGVEQVLQQLRLQAHDGLLLGDEAFIGHVDGDPDCCGCGPLARAGLQHEQLALLNCELDLVHVPVVLLQLLSYSHELPEHVGHEFFQRGKLTTMGQSSLQGELAWRTDTGHHILTLSIDKELPIEVVVPSGRISSESYTRGAIVAHVPEDHGLNIYRSAPLVWDAMQFPVGLGPGIGP